MAEFVRYTLDDGTEVIFEAAESTGLVDLHRGGASTEDGGVLATRLDGIAKTAQQIAESMLDQVRPDELELELGVKVSGELNAWFFAKTKTEATVNVRLTWKNPSSQPGAPDAAPTR
jgi:hypothetical protein